MVVMIVEKKFSLAWKHTFLFSSVPALIDALRKHFVHMSELLSFSGTDGPTYVLLSKNR